MPVSRPTSKLQNNISARLLHAYLGSLGRLKCFLSKIKLAGTSLMCAVVDSLLPMEGAGVRSLVRELDPIR